MKKLWCLHFLETFLAPTGAQGKGILSMCACAIFFKTESKIKYTNIHFLCIQDIQTYWLLTTADRKDLYIPIKHSCLINETHNVIFIVYLLFSLYGRVWADWPSKSPLHKTLPFANGSKEYRPQQKQIRCTWIYKAQFTCYQRIFHILHEDNECWCHFYFHLKVTSYIESKLWMYI